MALAVITDSITITHTSSRNHGAALLSVPLPLFIFPMGN